jgi:mannose-1-phosphate guanylyltransferase
VQAVILVGGFGTRLRPLTLSLPKQMLPVAGETMLERVVSRLADAGIEEVVLSLGYRPEVFTEAFPDNRCAGVRLRYAVEPEPLDTAGAIAFAADAAGISERFLALNGDVLTDLDLHALCDRHSETGAAATIA